MGESPSFLLFSDCFQRSHTNIRALVQLFKADLLSGGVCLRDGGGQAGRSCSHAQHAAAVCHHAALLIEFAACMEDIVAVPVFEVLQATDLKALLVMLRIACVFSSLRKRARES